MGPQGFEPFGPSGELWQIGNWVFGGGWGFFETEKEIAKLGWLLGRLGYGRGFAPIWFFFFFCTRNRAGL